MFAPLTHLAKALAVVDQPPQQLEVLLRRLDRTADGAADVGFSVHRDVPLDGATGQAVAQGPAAGFGPGGDDCVQEGALQVRQPVAALRDRMVSDDVWWNATAPMSSKVSGGRHLGEFGAVVL